MDLGRQASTCQPIEFYVLGGKGLAEIIAQVESWMKQEPGPSGARMASSM